jgi:hypothetical protein
MIDGVSSASGPRGALITGAMERVGAARRTRSPSRSRPRVLMPQSGTPLSDSPQVLGFWADIADTVSTEGFVTFADTRARRRSSWP